MITASAAAQVCSNQTSNMLANWKCSYDVAHPSTVQTGGGPTFAGHTSMTGIVVALVIVLLLITLASKGRGRSAATSR